MPRLSDPAKIRAILETDRAWSAYALGDLAPGFFEHSEWFAPPAPTGSPALILLYRAFETPVLFTLGEPDAVCDLLDEMGDEPKMYLSVRPEILPLVKERYSIRQEAAMWRMILDPASFRPAPTGGAERLGRADVPALQRLYADGAELGEAPDFFSPEMVTQGVFFGIREGEALIAAAGTHLVGLSDGVGAVGNVYTRRDRRGRGLGARVTSAVSAELLRLGLRTVALNVNRRNTLAIRVYDGLGYVRYCSFYEGLAVWKLF